MKVGVDIDGVLARFESGFAPLLTNITGIEFDIDAPTFPPVWQWPAHYGIEDLAEAEAWDTVKRSRDFWYKLDHYEHTCEALSRINKLSRAGHDFYFITTRMGRDAKLQTEQWLRDRGAENPTVCVSSDKGSVMRGLELDVHIDDYPKNFEKMPFSVRPFLQARPYNHDWYLNIGQYRGVHKVDNVLQMLNFVEAQAHRENKSAA